MAIVPEVWKKIIDILKTVKSIRTKYWTKKDLQNLINNLSIILSSTTSMLSFCWAIQYIFNIYFFKHIKMNPWTIQFAIKFAEQSNKVIPEDIIILDVARIADEITYLFRAVYCVYTNKKLVLPWLDAWLTFSRSAFVLTALIIPSLTHKPILKLVSIHNKHNMQDKCKREMKYVNVYRGVHNGDT